MFKTDVLTRTADRLKDAAISPRIYNRDCIKHCFVVADKYRSPVIIRINIHEFDIKEIAYISSYMEKTYVEAPVSLMAEGISNYEEAVAVVMAGYNGIAIDDSLLLNQEQNLQIIKDIARVARSLDVSVQVSVKQVETLTDEKGYELVKKGHIDMLKLMIGELNDDNIGKYQHIIHILRKETLVTLGTGEETRVETRLMKSLAEAGISKFDVYADYEKACVSRLADTFKMEPVKDKKLFMLELQDLMNAVFAQNLDYQIHKAGHFVKR